MSIRLLIGDCRQRLAELPDESVHCVVTSPPYFGLRDYGTASWVGGDPACDHRSPTMRAGRNEDQAMLAGSAATNSAQLLLAHNVALCGKCGATKADKQIGLEPTPAEFVAVMVEVFREVRRVLRSDGTCWVNLGDSYSSGGRATRDTESENKGNDGAAQSFRPRDGFKPKDLIGIPWRVAFALQADGWYLRQDIIWAKPNPMPESVTDRCTKAHEYLFLLSKSPRYHYDADAIREEPSGRIDPITSFGAPADRNDNGRSFDLDAIKGANRRSVWTVATQPLKSAVSYGKYRIGSRDCSVHDYRADLARVLECDAQQDVFRFARNPGNGARPVQLPEGAVVSIPSDLTAFPSDVTSAIAHSIASRKNGSLSGQDVICGDIPGGHSECREFLGHLFARSARTLVSNTAPDASADAPQIDPSAETERRIVGIATFEDRPSGCSCYYAGKVEKRQDHFASFPPDLIEPCILAGCPKGGTVLDPFGGAGTTGLVADRLQRDAILIELNPDYCTIASNRITDDAPLFATVGQ